MTRVSLRGMQLGIPTLRSGGPLTSFTDDFDRANGAIGNGWTGTTWTISSNSAINTPTEGANTVVNGTFDVDANWTKGADWTISGGAANKASPGTYNALSQAALTANTWYRIGATSTLVGAVLGLEATKGYSGTVNISGLATATLSFFANIGTGGTLDNVVANPLTGVFAYRQLAAGDAAASASMARTTAAPNNASGILLYVDASNWIVASHDGGFNRIMLIKLVGGTRTIVANVAGSYVADASLVLTRSGNNYSVAYNGSTLIAAAAINDAVFADADKWGIFATSAQTLFRSFAWAAA